MKICQRQFTQLLMQRNISAQADQQKIAIAAKAKARESIAEVQDPICTLRSKSKIVKIIETIKVFNATSNATLPVLALRIQSLCFATTTTYFGSFIIPFGW